MLIGVSGLAHRPRKLPRREAVDKWTVRAGARTGSLAVDNALRCPPHEPLPTCPQPATTNIKEPPSENSRSFFWKIQGVIAGDGTKAFANVLPSVCAIEEADTKLPKHGWFKESHVDLNFVLWLLAHGIDVGCAATSSAPYEPPRSLAPHVIFCRVWFGSHSHRSHRKECPQCTKPPANKAVAARDALGFEGQFDLNCAAVASRRD